MDPAVFGYIRVSQAEGASGLATQRRHPHRPRAQGRPHLHRRRLGPEHAPPRVDDNSGRRSSPATSSWSRGWTGWRVTSRRVSGPSKSCTPRASTSAPLRRAWTPETAAQPPGSCSTCCSPWPSGSGRPSGTGSRPAWTAPRPRAGPGAGRRRWTSEKMQAVRGFLDNGGSVSAAARNFGVSRPTVRAVRGRDLHGSVRHNLRPRQALGY